MARYMKALVAAVIAIAAMGAATSSAFGAGITSSTSSTTAVANPITLRDSTLANVIGGITLTATIASSATCNGTNLVTIGAVTGGAVRISSPAGYTATTSTPWAITTKCELSGTSLRIYILGVRFSITAGLFGTYTYTGDASGTLNAGGTTITGVTSSFTSDRGSTASFVAPWAFALSPSIGWALV